MPPSGAPQLRKIQTTAYRYASYDTPFWARENTQPGRWHAIGDGPTQYLSLSTDGAWAELIRAEHLMTDDELSMVSVEMWAVQVDQAMVADYSTFELAEAAGFAPGALVDDDYSACQREGVRLRGRGCAGVLSPSAALAGAINLTLFGAKTASSWERPPMLASSLPTMIVAKGAPPSGLLDRVRKQGSSHAGLTGYKARRREREG